MNLTHTLRAKFAAAALTGLMASGCCSTNDCCTTSECNTCSDQCGSSCDNSGCSAPWYSKCFPWCGKSYPRGRYAIPDVIPLGAVNRAHWHMMETNGEAADFVIYRHEFVDNSSELTPYGRDHIMEIAARMPSTPFPIIVQRSWNNADPELDQVAASWAAESAPDGRLFPDDLRESLGSQVEVNTDGDAWRLSFKHHPNYNDTEFDVWAAERLKATAWLDPVGERFQRIDYSLPKPVKGPSGGKLTRYEQSYELKTEPRWGFSYVSGFTIDLEAKAAFKRIERRFEAKVTDVYFFFASTDAEAQYDARREAGLQMASGPGSP